MTGSRVGGATSSRAVIKLFSYPELHVESSAKYRPIFIRCLFCKLIQVVEGQCNLKKYLRRNSIVVIFEGL